MNMLDLEIIEDTIHELEQEPISYDTCNRLASLYICREINKNGNMRMVDTSNDSIREEDCLFTSYNKYVDTKRRYQEYEIVDRLLICAMSNLCDDLLDFIAQLYHNTETEAERALIVEMVNKMRSVL